jgi:predicted 3-demethylubiquinone-9 3-methyltransferase (glyoxalase superfamily)
MTTNTICLWYERDGEEAARSSARTFSQSSVGAVHRAPSYYPAGEAGDVVAVEFTVIAIRCIGLNGGPPARVPCSLSGCGQATGSSTR